MKIVFNTHNVGLGNNGGSRTVIRCAETLAELGAEVVIYGNQGCSYNWHKLKVKYVNATRPPKSDVAISCGYRSLKSVRRSDADRKFNYIRGFELWQASENRLIESFKRVECLVNSQWLHNRLAKSGIKSRILYPGLDFDEYNIASARQDIIGGLFHKRHATKRHDDVVRVAKRIKYNLLMLNRDIRNPSRKDLVAFYNKIKVWVSPTELEGLHNCPMEASLCGCGLVVTDCESGGTSDYAIHEQTALVYPKRHIKTASRQVRRLIKDDKLRKQLNDNMIELLRSKIGDRKTNMSKFLKWCEE